MTLGREEAAVQARSAELRVMFAVPLCRAFLNRVTGRSGVRAFHLRVTGDVIRKLERHDKRSHEVPVSVECR